MAPRGPKPKPTHLKLVEGNPGKRKLGKEPKPRAVPPAAPDTLDGEALREWERTAPMLYRLGLLTEADAPSLAAYCEAYGRWHAANEGIKAAKEADPKNPLAGMVCTTANGGLMQHPLVGIVRRAGADMVKYATEFGMTPSARARIGGADPDKGGERDKFAGLLWGTGGDGS